jgi:16S rRNA (cytidine1402-2'-O)-methyltransferase
MPLISDPGYRLVGEAVERGIAVTVVPGASAPLAALVLSGLPTDRFHFAGYLPFKQAARRSFLAGLAGVAATLVLLESPRRLAAALADMADILGPREAAIARELTKLHEEVIRGRLDTLAGRFADAATPKGEIVLVVAPPEAEAPAPAERIDVDLRRALTTMSVRDAAAAVAVATGAPRRQVYERALEIGRKDDGP